MKKLIVSLSLAVLCLSTSIVFSQTTFTGAISNDWGEAGNWENGLPAAGNDATIPDGLTVNTGGFLTINFTIYNDGTINNFGTINNNSDGIIDNFGTIYNDGIINITNDGIIDNNGIIYNFVIIENYGIIENYWTIENYGTIRNNSGGTIGNTGFIDNNFGTINQCGTWIGPDSQPNSYSTANCPVPGCTDTSACNYDAAATSDDGSCVSIPEGACDCDGNVLDECGVCGGDDNSCNDACGVANGDNSTCSGCTYADATNYDSTATIDDGSCVFPDITSNDQEVYDEGAASVCPGDFSGDGNVNVSDLGGFLGAFGTACSIDPVTLAIGDTHQGGIVFYLNGSGGGLIAAPSDQSSAVWGCYGTPISGAAGTAIGTGNQNTIDIEAGCTTTGTAADICANLTLGVYSDWFLPSKDELNQMYLNIGQGNALGLGNIGGFANNYYWSSSEYDNYVVWGQHFYFGYQNYVNKYSDTGNVRAIRAF